MNEVDWQTALNKAFQFQKEDKVLLVMFVDTDCEICNAMLPVMYETAKKYPNEYEILTVKDYRGFPFPPTATPIGFVFIPNCPDQMPLKRIGGAPPEAIIADIQRQIKSLRQKRSYQEILEEEKSASTSG